MYYFSLYNFQTMRPEKFLIQNLRFEHMYIYKKINWPDLNDTNEH